MLWITTTAFRKLVSFPLSGPFLGKLLGVFFGTAFSRRV